MKEDAMFQKILTFMMLILIAIGLAIGIYFSFSINNNIR